jgi:hypothetical protein
MAAMTEYMSVPSWSLLHCEGLDLDELALVEPLAIGAHAARRATVSSNEFVLVIRGPDLLELEQWNLFRKCRWSCNCNGLNEDRLKACKEKFGIDHIVHAGKMTKLNR